mmetsp:Transcript_60612/g.168013  ORF Transcript_60612/g.168013 Transcript_60612/m.168013 type:complete len:292 (+) Transcript_60612:240-1115(+)
MRVGVSELPQGTGCSLALGQRGYVLRICAEALRPRPVHEGPAVQALVREVVAVRHVLRVAPGRCPQAAIELQSHRVRQVDPASRASMAFRPELVDERKVLPLGGQRLLSGRRVGGGRRRCRRRPRRRWRQCAVTPVAAALAGGVLHKAPEAVGIAVWIATVVVAGRVWKAAHQPGGQAGAPLLRVERNFLRLRRQVAHTSEPTQVRGGTDALWPGPHLTTLQLALVLYTLATVSGLAKVLAGGERGGPQVHLEVRVGAVVAVCSAARAVRATVHRLEKRVVWGLVAQTVIA